MYVFVVIQREMKRVKWHLLLLLFSRHTQTDLTLSIALILDTHGQRIIAGLVQTQLHPVQLWVDFAAQPRHWKVGIKNTCFIKASTLLEKPAAARRRRISLPWHSLACSGILWGHTTDRQTVSCMSAVAPNDSNLISRKTEIQKCTFLQRRSSDVLTQRWCCVGVNDHLTAEGDPGWLGDHQTDLNIHMLWAHWFVTACRYKASQ